MGSLVVGRFLVLSRSAMPVGQGWMFSHECLLTGCSERLTVPIAAQHFAEKTQNKTILAFCCDSSGSVLAQASVHGLVVAKK